MTVKTFARAAAPTRVAATLTLALGLVASSSALSPAGATTAPAAPPGEQLDDFAARGVQTLADNLSSPAEGVSRVHLDRGQMNGYKVRGAIPTATEATLTYRVRVPREVHDNGLAQVDLKMPGLAGSPADESPWYASSGGDLQHDSFSVRLHSRKSSSSSVGHPWWDAYIYAPYAAGESFDDWGISVPLSTDLNGDGERLPIPVDRWFDVTIHVALNTPGVNDGELNIWIDGQKGVALDDVQWRRAGVETPLNLLMAETFYNKPGAPQDGYIDFADFRVTPGAPARQVPATRSADEDGDRRWTAVGTEAWKRTAIQ